MICESNDSTISFPRLRKLWEERERERERANYTGRGEEEYHAFGSWILLGKVSQTLLVLRERERNFKSKNFFFLSSWYSDDIA